MPQRGLRPIDEDRHQQPPKVSDHRGVGTHPACLGDDGGARRRDGHLPLRPSAHGDCSRAGSCPTICAQVDHSARRPPQKAFEHRFPSHDAIRDVVSHQVDFGATMAERETHSIKPPWSRSFGNQTIEVAGSRPIRFADNLYDRVYCVTCRGGVHCYEITAETVKVLSAVREQT